MTGALVWRRRTAMTIRYVEPHAASGTVRVVAGGYEATGADGTLLRITGRPYGRGRRKWWELYVLRPGADRHECVRLSFSALLRETRALAEKAERDLRAMREARGRAMS